MAFPFIIIIIIIIIVITLLYLPALSEKLYKKKEGVGGKPFSMYCSL